MNSGRLSFRENVLWGLPKNFRVLQSVHVCISNELLLEQLNNHLLWMFEQANCPHFKTNYSNSPPCQNMNLVLTDSLFCSQSCSIQNVVFKWGIHSSKINQCILSIDQINNSDLNDFNKQYNTLRRQDDRIFLFPDGADHKGATGREIMAYFLYFVS